VFPSSFCNANILLFNSDRKRGNDWPSKGKDSHRGIVGQGKFHAHGRFFPIYSVQLGTDNEQQWIKLSNSRGEF
jgi:hypothetical protein